jgi:hypothetical protein
MAQGMRQVFLLLFAAAQSFDGTYVGTLACPALPEQTPLRTEFLLTVSGSTASYERAIVRPGTAGGVQTGSYERGRGTVTAAGEVELRGACEGGFSCTAEYRGQLTESSIRLLGTQHWRVRDRDALRDCEIDLVPRPKS